MSSNFKINEKFIVTSLANLLKLWRTPADEEVTYSTKLKFEDNQALRTYLKKNGHILSAEA